MPLRKASLEVLDQLEQTVAASRAIYTASKFGSPIGKHIRHILDHFDVLTTGVQQGLIDYNIRTRNSDAELNPDSALARLDIIRGALAAISDLDAPIVIETEVSVHERESQRLSSSVGRELAYVESHTIHHLAYIRLIASYFEVELDTAIGVAPATASFLRSK